MGVSGGPIIVRGSSLVLELDAADRNSYRSGSTTWFDLTTNNNSGSLINGPTFSSANGGTIVFNGSSNYVTGSTSANFAFGTGDFTISYWTYINAFTGAGTTPVFVDLRTNATGQGPGYSDYIQNNKFKLFWANADRYTSSGNIFSGIWYNIVAQRRSTTVSVYFNGVLDGTSIDSTNLTENGFRLARNLGSVYLSGSMASVQIYNKALSAQEIQQNYNQLKSRFNL